MEGRRPLRLGFGVACLMGTVGLAATASACDSGTNARGGATLQVVAAENFWGSVVSQLGGSHVHVTSVVTDPNADPHDYQSSASDARAIATADYVIVNGAGYDDWASNLLSANQSASRKVFTVATLLGKSQGDNPHFWYNPAYVEQVADQITKDLTAIDSADSAYFTQQRSAFETALQPYHERIAAIKQHFSGQRIASTESIFVYMANALDLDLITPPEFMKAVAEGNDPPAETVATFQQQLQTRQVTVLVYNEQTATDVTNTLKQLASQQNIPIVGVTETIQPPDSTFQLWMTGELNDLQNALNATNLTQ
ncbi:MAG: zinc ABC transporter substrate-binding protein [Candidatus Dormibacteraeota bacterium]|nr:zinc ABC transporter substrate-binding protein [Candidatus Dormibacteraeota bacterium]